MRVADARLSASAGLGHLELARLQQIEVAVIGVGVLGGQLAYHLGLLGVGLTLVDSGRVEPENLGNQGFATADVGESKSVARQRQIAAINPDCRVEAVTARVEDVGLAALAGVRLLATGLDGRASRVHVNEIAWRLGVPWIDAAVDGTGRWLRGTVSVRDPGRPNAACYVCRYDARDLGSIAREGQAVGCPSWRDARRRVTPPTLQASAFAAVVAGFQALCATRLLLGQVDTLAGRQLVLEADTAPAARVCTLRCNPRCLFDHERFRPLERSSALRIGDLLDAVSTALGAEVDEVAFHGRTIALGLTCPRCGCERDLVRVTQAYADAEVRCDCGAEDDMTPRRLTTTLVGADLRRCAPLTWTALGVPVDDVVTVRAGDHRLHYVVNERAAAVHAQGGSDG